MQEYDPIKKILNRERIHTHLKNKMISGCYMLALLAFLSLATWVLFYLTMYHWFARWTVFVHIVFIPLAVMILALLVKKLLPILALARMVKGDRYIVVEDEIDYLEENGIKGMHLAYHSVSRISKWRWEPIIEHAIVFKNKGRLLVERYQLKGHDRGDKVYLVLPEDRPDHIVLYFNANQYELDI